METVRVSTSAAADSTNLEIEEARDMGEDSETTELEMGEKTQAGRVFDLYLRAMESNWSRLFSSPCKDTTSLSPMHFTHSAPGRAPDAAFAASALQIFSVRVAEITDALELKWPLHLYGMVAARDTVDHNRNILFLRGRNNCQILTQKDCCLQLTGPSRAIVAIDPVDIEIKLKVKGTTKSEDRVLMHQTFNYSGGNEITLLNDFCRIMLQCAKLEKTVQATIVSVRVLNWRKKKWPFKHDGKVSCIAKGASKPVKPQGEQPEEELVLQDQVTANSSDGYLDLSRNVVSVELNGKLEVIIRASKSRSPKSLGHVIFPAQECKVSRGICDLGAHKVEVTVAWSMLIRDKWYMSNEGCVDGQTFEHTAKIRSRKHAEQTSETASATEKVRAEIYSLLNLISENSMKLKPEPKLRISEYSISEVQIHMDNMYKDVTSLLQMMEKQNRETYYKYGLNAIFNELDQLCTRLDQMGHLSYNGKDEVSPRISSSTEIKLEMGEDAEMNKVLTDEEFFASYRDGWVSNWSRFHGTFIETTSLSPMHFTHTTPGHRPFSAFVDSTLQIYSLKVAELEDGSGLNWPLEVYGVVAARDNVDHNRNVLFSRRRNHCQILTPEDPFLRLTGPSRAIVSREPLHVEIELKVKGGTKSEDRSLMTHFWYYSGSHCGLCTLYTPLEGDFCTMALSSEEVHDSVQATIVGIRVSVPEGKPSPFEYGGRVVCSSLPQRRSTLPASEHRTDPSFRKVVLQDGAMNCCSEGYLDLTRQVVSVELCGTLEVIAEANSQSGALAGHVSIKAQKCNITQDVCHLGDSQLEITVAWSALVRDKLWVSRKGREEL